jgi:hypothetical protein
MTLGTWATSLVDINNKASTIKGNNIRFMISSSSNFLLFGTPLFDK